MEVIIISECSKRALKETRKVLDNFGERHGRRTWIIKIPQDGLGVVEKLLRKTARKNSAISCFKIYKSSHKLLWTVGKKGVFSDTGVVRTNYSHKENTMSELIGYINNSSLSHLTIGAALFHDIGKANDSFQKKLIGECESEPFCHEFISAVLFLLLIQDEDGEFPQTDFEWIESFGRMDIGSWNKRCARAEGNCLKYCSKKLFKNISHLPIAQFVLSLILCHHKLFSIDIESCRHREKILLVIDRKNTRTFPKGCGSEADKEEKENTSFSKGLPRDPVLVKMISENFRKLALDKSFIKSLENPLQSNYCFKICLAILKEADYEYSSYDRGSSKRVVLINNEEIYANTDKGVVKQFLSEHLVGVAGLVSKKFKKLLREKDRLPKLICNKLKENTKNEKFTWQNDAYEKCLAANKHIVENHACRALVMVRAAMGRGKTMANVRCASALSDNRSRFAYALSMRKLASQTGKKIEEMGISPDDLNIMIGGGYSDTGDIIDQEGFSRDKRNRPVQVATLDHLIRLSEGVQGRDGVIEKISILGIDTVIIDEIDDYGEEDLASVIYYIYNLGCFGVNVIISSGTMRSELMKSVCDAYSYGLRDYFKHHYGVDKFSVYGIYSDEHGTESKVSYYE